MTQIESALKNSFTEEMKIVADSENIEIEDVIELIKKGEVVIPKNINHKFKARGIGKNLRTKVNVNIGTSQDCQDVEYELKKLEAAEKFGADAVMDLSTGGDLNKIRNLIIQKSGICMGTVPVYEMAVISAGKYGSTDKMDKELMFDVIEKQCEQGVDFITVHCGVTKTVIEKLKFEKRILNIVSRGGAMLTSWIEYNKKENPLYEHYDRLLKIAKKYDVTLSLGDGFRPGCLSDATDRAQIQELILLGELTELAWKEGVQVMIEGPGHIPLNQIQSNMELQKRLCHNAPFYVLGPLVTDIAPGYDHITSAIGGALAAYYGADFLCYVTPAEHLRLPSLEDVKLGLIASRIAAHSADIAKGIAGSKKIDDEMAAGRMNLDWETQIKCSIDPELVRKARNENQPKNKDVCTMCSDYCAVKKIKETFKN
ncbi:phosphomethylpyrimidine synthase ThiC [Candidatus Dependentiae bacterium]|nr:phosphomethylpyrimidine synthase ThiC [Candidatus Dependentiae bacterium]